MVITQNVNSKLEEKIINLEKNQAKGEQCNRRNNVELPRIPDSISDEDLENTVINICKESEIDIEARDTEGCHRLPLSRSSRSHDKRVKVKFVNRKDVEPLLTDKKRISGNGSDIYMSLATFLCLSPFAHTTDISSVGIFKDKERYTMLFV